MKQRNQPELKEISLMERFSHLLHLQILLILSMIAAANSESGYGYGANPHVQPSKSTGNEFLPGVFSLQGIVYCKSGPKLFPFKACLGVDKYGYETAPFSVLSGPTDGNGYFLSKLSSKLLEDEGVKIFQCKAFLHSPPLDSCQVTIDVNKGLSGAPLSSYRPVGSKSMRLYSVGSFVYASEPKQSPPSLITDFNRNFM